ncbi:MAG: hypothetical protein J4G12_09045 [Gemmatimonadetes bacterium]|nr:hypothetical protein [Gemmatimonadota bacterium]
MAETAGERLKKLAERQLDDRDYPIVYVDGIRFCGHHILAALGVDAESHKRILDPGRARLFVLDGSKALSKAVGQVFGSSCLVERCRNHKMRNVTGHLPKALHDPGPRRAAGRPEAGREGRQIEQFAPGWRSSVRTQGKPARGAPRDDRRQRDRTDLGTPAVPGARPTSSTTSTGEGAAAQAG